MTTEQTRLDETREPKAPWMKYGHAHLRRR